jgi:hexokinase
VQETKDKAAAFLTRHGMYHADISMEGLCGVFLDEMRRGLTETGSSLAMLPTYIETERQVPRNKPVIVMDAGGTNFRVGTVCFKDEGAPEIGAFRVFPMPGIKEEVGKERFFGVMAGYIADIVNTSESIGFCFSYPIEMFPSKDGRVLYFSKEIKAPEVVGQMIGAGLNEAIGESTDAGAKQIVLLNDTVATLLAGKAHSAGRNYDSYIGFILGTGTNTSYVEQNRNIAKAKDLDPTRAQIVNVESGGFGKAPRGTVDEQLDAESAGPGVNVFEKMISGAYIGPMCSATMRLAATEGLFSKDTARTLLALPQTSTKDISGFLSSPEGSDNPLAKALAQAPHGDVATLYCLIDALIERAAKLTAANLSSAAIKCDKGRDPTRPVCIVAEGTTFYHLTSLRQKIEYYLKQYLVDGQGVYYQIATVENATLIGAAIAGLTN